MGELFKHFEGWDVQALRREIAEAKEETERVAKEVTTREREVGIHKLLNVLKKCHIIPEDAMKQLMEEYHLSEEEASEKITLYW